MLEAKLDKGRGPVATVLVQDGTLDVGDTFIAGPIVGRVARAHRRPRQADEDRPGRRRRSKCSACRGLPQPGDVFQVADAAKARHIATFREEQSKSSALGAKGLAAHARIAAGADRRRRHERSCRSSSRPTCRARPKCWPTRSTKLTDEKVKIRIIHAGVGAVNESDVLLASASKAIIIAFNVRPDRNAEEIAARERVDIRQHSVIYNVTDEMKKAMTGLLDPTFKEVRIGVAEVRDIFKVPKFGTIAGCMVREGAHHPRRRHAGAAAPRQRRHLRRQDRLAAPLQGRRQRGQVGLRVRHRLRQVQRPEGRRRDRGVRDGTGADAGLDLVRAAVRSTSNPTRSDLNSNVAGSVQTASPIRSAAKSRRCSRATCTTRASAS
mgnify:CR=1 FL=1